MTLVKEIESSSDGLNISLFSATKIKSMLLFLMLLIIIVALVLYKVVFIANMPLKFSFWPFYSFITTIFLVSRLPYAYLYKDDHEKKYLDSEYPNVSVVIAAKNEEAGIFKTIVTCIESDYPGKIECIVVDDGSTDGTKNEVIKAQSFYGRKIKLISFAKNQGKREAMTVGINEALHEIIIFVDSDSFIAPDAIRHITEHFLVDEKIGAVSGNTKVENINKNLLTKMQSILYAVSFDVYKASESVHRSVTCCPGCFSAYRKNIIQPLLKQWKSRTFLGSKSTFGDDRALTNMVLQNWDVVYCEKAKATTMVPEKFKVYWRQQLRWKKSWIREGLFAALFIWKKKHPLAGFAFYTSLSFCVVGPILASKVIINSIMLRNPLLLIIFLSGFILLGLVFALFVSVYRDAKNFMYMPVVSFLFVSCFMWQMLYALATLKKNHWGTR